MYPPVCAYKALNYYLIESISKVPIDIKQYKSVLILFTRFGLQFVVEQNVFS